MRRITGISLALMGALAISACGNDTRRTDTPAGAAGTAGTAADVDRSWVADRLEDGDREVRLGRLAQEKASHADVRAFGGMMVEHHTRAGTELKRVADRHAIAAATGDRGENDRDFERLSGLSGVEFDRAYLDAMVDGHEDAVDELEGKVNDDGEHADVRAWASQTLPIVREHLARAKELRDRAENNM